MNLVPDASQPPQGLPIPGQPMQILLPPQLQEIMQQFPSVLTRVAACEAKPVAVSPSAGSIAVAAFLAGMGVMALAVFLWNVRSLFL